MAAVEDVMVQDGIITADLLAKVRAEAQVAKEPLISYMISHKYITDEQLVKTRSEMSHLPYINLLNAYVDPKFLKILPEDIASHYMAVPIGETSNQVIVAMLDGENIQAIDFLANRIRKPLKVYVASEAGIKRILKQYQATVDTGSLGIKEGEGQTDATTAGQDQQSRGISLEDMVQDSPVSKALSMLLEFAAHNHASDIHIEPTLKDLKVRARIDGVLREVMHLPKSTEAALVSRIKILSTLKIDEHRIPQDGQFTVNIDGKDVDLRVAIGPTVWGEEVVIRLLDKSGTSLRLEDMGYRGRSLRMIRHGLKQSNGMILASGPTGSGKSTSMYALIQEIKGEATNIVTLEDPVEYKMEGINQIQVNADVGLTFASGLRSILRQDPDVIMVGEIRDAETAQLAVQAALTGHLVFSTLHTNSAAGILPRLLDMGIEPFLIASTVRTVIGQRLVRRIPPGLGQQYGSSPAETLAVQATLSGLLPESPDKMAAAAQDLGYESLPLANQKAYTLTKGTDGPETPGGFKGRMGLYEVFEVSESIQSLIMKRAASSEISKQAELEGMISMRRDGYLKALAGNTTIAEIDRVAAEGNI